MLDILLGAAFGALIGVMIVWLRDQKERDQKEKERNRELRIVFDGQPGPEAGRFIECEDSNGKSVNAGEWRERPDGLWELVITQLPVSTPANDG